MYVFDLVYTRCHQPPRVALMKMSQCLTTITMCGWDKGSSLCIIDIKDALYVMLNYISMYGEWNQIGLEVSKNKLSL